MIQFSYTVRDPLGLHARPAGQLVKLAKGLSSRVVIGKADKTVDARQLIALMGLNVLQGETVTVSVEGAQEEADLQTLQTFFQENL